MAPVVRGAELLEVTLEGIAHADDAVGHALDLSQPLILEIARVEDLGGDASAVDGRVGVERAMYLLNSRYSLTSMQNLPNENLDLRVDLGLLLLAGSNDGESTNTLTIETHVLGKALAESNGETLVDKVPQSIGITVNVARGETLVGHVEEGKVATLLNLGCNSLPLLGSGVDTSGVVGTSVEQEDRTGRSVLDIIEHTLKVKTDGVLVVVPVLLHGDAGIAEDGLVVCPGWVGEVDGLVSGVEALKERSTNSQSTSSRDGLGNGNGIRSKRLALLAVGKVGSSLGEGALTGDGGIFLVESVLEDTLLSLEDGGEDKWLALVVTVGTDTDVDLLGVGITLVGLSDTCKMLGG